MAKYFTALSIVLTFAEYVSTLIIINLNYFSGTKVASSASPTLPTGMSHFRTTSAITAVSFWPYVIPDVSIASLSFKLSYNSHIRTLLLKNSPTSIGFTSEIPTQRFAGVYIL